MADYASALLGDSPELASISGLTPEQAGGRFAHRLDDRSAQALLLRRGQPLRRIAELKSIDPAKLTGVDLVSYETVLAQQDLLHAGAGFEFGQYGALTGFAPYVLNQLDAAFTALPDFLDSRAEVRSLADGEDFLARLRAVPLALDQETERARADAAAGIAAPSFILDRVNAALSNFPQGGAYPAVQALRRKFEQVFGAFPADPAQYSPDQRRAAQLLVEAESVARDKIAPAYGRARAALDVMRPKANPQAGVIGLANGADYYAAALAYQTTTKLTPKEVHAIGLQRVSEISAQMDIQLRALGLMAGTVGERMAALTADPRFLFSNTPEGRAALLALLNDVLARINAKVPQWFGVTPKAAMEIRPVPVFAEPFQPGAYYQPPALDGSRPGVFSINLRDTAEQPRLDLPTLVAHEAVPGHHFQIALAQEQPNMPLARRFTSFNAFAEGWGLYAEQLADEMGLYEQDGYGRLGYLRWQLWRAARLVVDTGLHDQGWTRDQAIQYIAATTGDTISTIITEVDRYCVWPGQACGYEIGRLEIARQRERARASLGAAFDIKAFHDLLLTTGDVPMTVLDRVVGRWIAARGGK